MFDECDDALQPVADALRAAVALSPSFDARVMASVRRARRPARPGWWARLAQPRTITITPLRWALAASVAAMVSFGLTSSGVASVAGRAKHALLGRAHTPAPQRVQFVLVAPTARKVAVVGDFNGWDPTHAGYQARHRGGGVWSVTAAVPVGHHRYSFIVDDSVWVPDPTAPRVIDNDFGMPNSALVVEENR